MSASTSRDATETPARRRSSTLRQTSSGWWILSIFLHTACIGALIIFTPLRELVLSKPLSPDILKQQTQTNLRGNELEQAVEDLRDLHEKSMRSKVDQLEQIREEMEKNFELKSAEYEKVTGKKLDISEPDKSAEALLQEADKLQDESSRKKEEYAELKEQANAKTLEAEKISKQVSAEAEKKDKAHADIESLKKQIKELTQNHRQTVNDIRKYENKRRNANNQYKRLQQEVVNLQNIADGAHQQSENEKKQAETFGQESERRKEEADRVKTEQAKLLAESKTALEQKNQNLSNQKKQQASDRQRHAGEISRLAREAQQRLNEHLKRSKSWTNKEIAAKEKAQKKQTEANKKSEKHIALFKTKQEKTREAVELQQEIDRLSERLRITEESMRLAAESAKRLAEDLKLISTDARDATTHAEEKIKQAAYLENMSRRQRFLAKTETGEKRDTASMDIPQLYDAARDTEDSIAETYRKIRAAELAMIQNIGIDEALKNTDVARPMRPELKQEILRKAIANPQELDAHSAEIKKATAEMEDMLLLAADLKNMTERLFDKGKDGFSVSVERVDKKAALEADLLQAADVNTSGRYSDVSSKMKRADKELKLADESNNASSNDNSGKGAGDGSDEKVTGEALEKTILPNYQPVIDRKNWHPAAGRKVGTGGDGAEWMYIDSWYLIGPFPNPNRQNINKKFPPETVVDLDATYEGMNGRMTRWEFIQTGNPMLVPKNQKSYAVYYAYSELMFDRDTDLWAAMGSDDEGKVWINDQLIWVSSQQHKPWNPDESFRKVHFRRGRNRILFRLENGQLGCGLSFSLHVNPPLSRQ